MAYEILIKYILKNVQPYKHYIKIFKILTANKYRMHDYYDNDNMIR